MYDYKRIKNVHLEPSSLCNAECPVCNRRLSGGPKNPIMTERCITLDEFKEWFSVDFLKQLDQLILCGNYGDPMTSPHLIDILSYFREVNPIGFISMNTNASGRDKKFWKDLSKIIGKYGRVVFSVDGLKDTNHLYRKGTNWKKIMDAMTSFMSTKKAKAEWEFLVFEHNQHQISEARGLAKELGITEFWPKKAMGFNDVGKESIKREIQVLDHDGRLDYKIYAPDDRWKNESLLKKVYKETETNDNRTVVLQDVSNSFDYSIKIKESMNWLDEEIINKLDSCNISCASLEIQTEKGNDWQTIFVDSTGLVFPCCFTGGKYYAGNSFETLQFREFVESFGEDTIRLNKNNNIEKIIQSDIMKKGYVDRWNKSSTKEGKLFTCSTFCGKNINDEIRSTKNSIGGWV